MRNRESGNYQKWAEKYLRVLTGDTKNEIPLMHLSIKEKWGKHASLYKAILSLRHLLMNKVRGNGM